MSDRHRQPKPTKKPRAPKKTAPVRESPAKPQTMPGWMSHEFSAAAPLNEHELTSIAALITYVAHTTKHHEVYVERQFADRFNIPNVKCLPAERYDDAIRYLVDQVPNEPAANA